MFYKRTSKNSRTNIIKKTEQEVQEFGSSNSSLICIGKKSHDYFKRRNYHIIDSYKDFWNTLNISMALKIGEIIIDKYLNKEIDAVDVIYNEFISVASQKIICKSFLPIAYEADEKKSCDLLYEPSKECRCRLSCLE